MRCKKSSKLLLTILVVLSLIVLLRFAIKKVYPLKYADYIQKYSVEYKLDPYLVSALIKAESNYKNEAKSHKSANGLMQITGGTGEWIAAKMKINGYSNELLYNPEINIKMGCWYLNNLREEFGEDIHLVLAAYNAGRGNVKSWLEDKNYSKDGKTLDYIPYKETDQYIKKIETNYNIYKFLYKKEFKIYN
jgi:Soluble lytic murein transglycosylase and related regulatory proteins (some contain LysM/invasin domains)